MRKGVLSVGTPSLLMLLAFIVPSYSLTYDVSILLTVVSFLFAILIGFFISAATTNYQQMQTLIAHEDGSLIAILNLARLSDPQADQKIAEPLDRYVIGALNYELEHYVKETDKDFANFIEALKAIRPEGSVGESVFPYMWEVASGLHETRHEISLVSRRIVRGLHWCILLFQAILIWMLLYSFRQEGDIFGSLIVGVLAVATYLILLLVYELDGKTFMEDQLAYENSQQIFSALGRHPYYPAEVLNAGRIQVPEGAYRLGELQVDGTREIKEISPHGSV